MLALLLPLLNPACVLTTFDRRDMKRRLVQQFPADMYYYNYQKRAVDSKRPSLTPAPEMCENMCKDQFEGMVPAKDDDSWSHQVKLPSGDGYHTICSRHDVYLDLDDMCKHCA